MQQQQATADGQVLQQTEYLYELGSFRPMAQVTHHEQGSELHYIVTDHAGTPQELCNEQGDIVWRGEQALWGHYHGQSQRHWQRREEAVNDSIQCDLRYQGQLEDPESGLYYNVNRYYDADSGQYLSPDPIGFAGGLRPQAYVANPLEWVDPLGLAGCGSKDINETTPEVAKSGKNSSAEDVIQYEKLKAQYAQLEVQSSPVSGSGLKGAGYFSPRTFGKKFDAEHNSAFWMQDQISQGRHFTIRGGDGVYRNLSQVKGQLNGKDGVFEYIVDPVKGITHQRFKAGRGITGIAN
ncbi:RHS repeat domain-containing protein [Salinivibrio kushneri]|uniref:RHS repeat domain-containing protein n=1 Tax=Salinivibrio kushneri TaxID=1908198 RepID=UPI001F523ADA|nr:RHS repeat-associated core domain-containing protein [Salinivibrio kushneri]